MNALPGNVFSAVIGDLVAANNTRFNAEGLCGTSAQLSWQICYACTAAFIKVMMPQEVRTVALGMDAQPGSPAIAAACAAAIHDAGLFVDFCGLLPTPALAGYALKIGIPSVMAIGSDAGSDCGGVRFFGPNGLINEAEEEMMRRAEVSLPVQHQFASLPPCNPVPLRLYADRYRRFFPERVLSGMRVGIFAHFGVVRGLLKELLEYLGAQVVPLGRPDDVLSTAGMSMNTSCQLLVRQWLKDFCLDAVVSTDADADVPLLADENGDWLSGDMIGMLCARYLQADAVAATVNCTTAIDLCGFFDKHVKTRVDTRHVVNGVAGLIDAGSTRVVGFEANGGVLLGSGIYSERRSLPPLLARDAVLPVLCLLAMARENACTVSDLVHSVPQRFTASGRLRQFPLAVSAPVLEGLGVSPLVVEEFLDGLPGTTLDIDLTDGVRALMDNGDIVHFRSCNAGNNDSDIECYTDAASADHAAFLLRFCLDRFERCRQPTPLAPCKYQSVCRSRGLNYFPG